MLKLQDVSSYYGKSQALFGVSFELKEREVLAILGRNGAGKTTTLRAIMGLNEVATGSIEFKGQPIAGKKPHKIARAGIGYVPEKRDVFSYLTVRENILLGSRSGSAFNIEAALEWFPELGDLLNRNAAQLSGGQQQMMVIARALATEPQLLLLDEPSQGLAPVVLGAIRQAIHRLRSSPISIVLVEQNLDFALSVSDRAVVIDHGQVVDRFTAAELTSDVARLHARLDVR